jgi:hypothetical protein
MTDTAEFFEGRPESAALFEALRTTIDGLAETEVRITKSQIAFARPALKASRSRSRPFAWAWVPGRYLRGSQAPLVLSVALDRRDPSSRWKEVVQPTSRRYMHHLELRTVADIDGQVRAWLSEAWEHAGSSEP